MFSNINKLYSYYFRAPRDFLYHIHATNLKTNFLLCEYCIQLMPLKRYCFYFNRSWHLNISLLESLAMALH